MTAHFLRAFQFRQYPPRQLFAQLHSPLVEAEDVPDHALYEDLVFIEGDERPQAERRDLF